MQDIMKKLGLVKRNLIISILILVEHNCLLSRLSSIEKGEMLVDHPTSGAKKWCSQ